MRFTKQQLSLDQNHFFNFKGKILRIWLISHQLFRSFKSFQLCGLPHEEMIKAGCMYSQRVIIHKNVKPKTQTELSLCPKL